MPGKQLLNAAADEGSAEQFPPRVYGSLQRLVKWEILCAELNASSQLAKFKKSGLETWSIRVRRLHEENVKIIGQLVKELNATPGQGNGNRSVSSEIVQLYFDAACSPSAAVNATNSSPRPQSSNDESDLDAESVKLDFVLRKLRIPEYISALIAYRATSNPANTNSDDGFGNANDDGPGLAGVNEDNVLDVQGLADVLLKKIEPLYCDLPDEDKQTLISHARDDQEEGDSSGDEHDEQSLPKPVPPVDNHNANGLSPDAPHRLPTGDHAPARQVVADPESDVAASNYDTGLQEEAPREMIEPEQCTDAGLAVVDIRPYKVDLHLGACQRGYVCQLVDDQFPVTLSCVEPDTGEEAYDTDMVAGETVAGETVAGETGYNAEPVQAEESYNPQPVEDAEPVDVEKGHDDAEPVDAEKGHDDAEPADAEKGHDDAEPADAEKGHDDAEPVDREEGYDAEPDLQALMGAHGATQTKFTEAEQCTDLGLAAGVDVAAPVQPQESESPGGANDSAEQVDMEKATDHDKRISRLSRTASAPPVLGQAVQESCDQLSFGHVSFPVVPYQKMMCVRRTSSWPADVFTSWWLRESSMAGSAYTDSDGTSLKRQGSMVLRQHEMSPRRHQSASGKLEMYSRQASLRKPVPANATATPLVADTPPPPVSTDESLDNNGDIVVGDPFDDPDRDFVPNDEEPEGVIDDAAHTATAEGTVDVTPHTAMAEGTVDVTTGSHPTGTASLNAAHDSTDLAVASLPPTIEGPPASELATPTPPRRGATVRARFRQSVCNLLHRGANGSQEFPPVILEEEPFEVLALDDISHEPPASHGEATASENVSEASRRPPPVPMAGIHRPFQAVCSRLKQRAGTGTGAARHVILEKEEEYIMVETQHADGMPDVAAEQTEDTLTIRSAGDGADSPAPTTPTPSPRTWRKRKGRKKESSS